MPKPLSTRKRSAILADIKAGTKARNQIARDHGVSPGTVTNIAKAAAVTGAFDRSKTKSATGAAVADARAVRAATSRRFLDEANKLLDQLHQPHVAFNFGGKDNTYEEHKFREPPVDAKRTLITSAAIAFDKHMAADKHDADDSVATSSVDQWLDSLTAGEGH